MLCPSSRPLKFKRTLSVGTTRPARWVRQPLTNNAPVGSDIELAEVTLRAIGVSEIEYVLTTFGELLPGVRDGRWDMNVPIFISKEREEIVTFSVPVWALADGFVVRRGNPKAVTSYESIAARSDAILGIVSGTVQKDTALNAGVTAKQIVKFQSQHEAITALLAGKIDAYSATAVGNREIVATNRELEAVGNEVSSNGSVPVGAFSFNKNNHTLINAVNDQLRKYLGSEDHRARMAKYGITKTEIDGVV
ncbi:transporter substrate-binding domain-containing protein [Pandoraea soli]